MSITVKTFNEKEIFTRLKYHNYLDIIQYIQALKTVINEERKLTRQALSKLRKKDNW